MKPLNLEQLLQLIQDMADLETTLARLYELCSLTFPDDTHFWTAIQRQEEQHAESLKMIAAIVASNPREFSVDQTFNPTAVNTIKKGVLGHIDALKQGTITRARMMMIARDIEASLIEAKYTKLIKTTNVQFMEVISRIEDQTVTHKNLMVKKLASGSFRKTP